MLRSELHTVLRLPDETLRRGVHDLLNGEGVLAEGAAAASIAGADAMREEIVGSTVVLPITGRNISLAKLRTILDEHAGRRT